MTLYLSPRGTKIVGALVHMEARAEIDGIADDGKPEFSGNTEIMWDGDAQEQKKDGKTVYLDDSGAEFTFDQLIKIGDHPAAGPAPKYYRTTFTYEVLSESPIGDCLDLRTLHSLVMEGDCVGRFGDTSATELTGKEAAEALADFGSEPGFFMLDDAGHALDGENNRRFDYGIAVDEEEGGFSVSVAGMTVYNGEVFPDRETADAHAELLEAAIGQHA